MTLKDQSIRYRSGSIVFMVCMLINLFVVCSTDAMIEYIDIPHVVLRILPLYLILAIMAVYLLWAFARTGDLFQVDAVCVLLLVRIIVNAIPALYVEQSGHYDSNLIISGVCLLVYAIGLNFTHDQRSVQWAIRIFFIVICVQTVVESMIGQYNFFDYVYDYKHDLSLPIGSSNAIATKVVPCFAFLLCQEKKERYRILLLATALLTVALTKSRSGVIMVMAAFGMVMAWKDRISVKNTVKVGALLAVIAAAFLMFMMVTDLGGYIFSSSSSTVNGRIELWKNGLRVFAEHPLFGQSMSDAVYSANPHNIIIQIMMRSGVVGLLLFGLLLVVPLSDIKDKTDDDFIRGSVCFCLCMLGQNMVEIVLFAYVHDMMFWFIMGSMMARAGDLRDKAAATSVPQRGIQA